MPFFTVAANRNIMPSKTERHLHFKQLYSHVQRKLMLSLNMIPVLSIFKHIGCEITPLTEVKKVFFFPGLHLS